MSDDGCLGGSDSPDAAAASPAAQQQDVHLSFQVGQVSYNFNCIDLNIDLQFSFLFKISNHKKSKHFSLDSLKNLSLQCSI